ncbi:hypothetical protein KGF56_000847 [Candida oxycetoniae]|uniref:Rad21/Rec8-like protein N-terminal domain-containing protein n=1 Tax=Candida oxycetoniae TaxID=497107 RepID=A0AAI9T028_9ASCO|nr:uncharacterized protein KGF56_000847 [Candida oxycetoniae]KAI3406366.2 hypothetical protein KGF56_000847 [Candida oxycetoniae]
MEVEYKASSGLQTAWLLATLGSKASSRSKIIRKEEIMQVSIPRICRELIEQPETNIKYQSHILHGISIIYTTKTSHVLNDVNYIQMRLQNSHRFLSKESLEKPSNVSSKRGRYLEDDANFYLNLDSMPELDLDLDLDLGTCQDDNSAAKRRKLQIAKFDQNEFPVTFENKIEQVGGLAFALSMNEQESKEVDGFFDTSFNFGGFRNGNEEELLQDQKHGVRMEFDEEGNLQEIRQKEMQNELLQNGGDDDDGDANFDLEISRLQQEDGLNSSSQEFGMEQEFQMSTNAVSNQAQTSGGGSSSRLAQNRLYKLRLDNESTMPRDEAILNHYNYIHNMKQRMPCKIHNISEIIESINHSYLRPWVRGTNNTLVNSMLEESISRTMGVYQRTEIMENEASEQARNAQHIERSRNYDQSVLEYGEELRLQDEVFEEDLLGMDLNLEQSDENNEQEQEQEQVDIDHEENHHNHQEISFEFSRSSSINSSEVEKSLTPRLNHFVKYFKSKSIELESFDVDCNTYQLKFSELVPEITTPTHETAPVSKKLAANAFASILFLASKGLMEIKSKVPSQENQLLKACDITMVMSL